MEAKLYQNCDRLYEIISSFSDCAVVTQINSDKFKFISKPTIEDYKIKWHLTFEFSDKSSAISFAKEFNIMYNDIQDSYKVIETCEKIDNALYSNSQDYHYNLEATYDELHKQYSTFDIAAATALTVKQHNYNGRDTRYSEETCQWANNFLEENDVDFNNFKSTPLCNAHSTVMNGFAKKLKDKLENIPLQELYAQPDNDLDLTNKTGLSR